MLESFLGFKLLLLFVFVSFFGLFTFYSIWHLHQLDMFVAHDNYTLTCEIVHLLVNMSVSV